MSRFSYPIPNGGVFHLNIDATRWEDPEILKVLRKIELAVLLHDSLKKLVKEMAPVVIISQSQDYKEAVELLSILEPL